MIDKKKWIWISIIVLKDLWKIVPAIKNHRKYLATFPFFAFKWKNKVLLLNSKNTGNELIRCISFWVFVTFGFSLLLLDNINFYRLQILLKTRGNLGTTTELFSFHVSPSSCERQKRASLNVRWRVTSSINKDYLTEVSQQEQYCRIWHHRLTENLN